MFKRFKLYAICSLTIHTTSTARHRKLKTEISLWKCIKCVPFTLRRKNLCLRKPLSGKSHGYRNVIGFEKLRVQNVLRPCENEKPAFSHSSGLKRKSIFRGGNLNFDRNLIYYFNRWSPLLSQHFYRACHTVGIQMTLTIAVLIHSLFKPMGRIYSTWKGDVSFCANTRHGCNPSSVSFFCCHSLLLELPLQSFTYRFSKSFL